MKTKTNKIYVEESINDTDELMEKDLLKIIEIRKIRVQKIEIEQNEINRDFDKSKKKLLEFSELLEKLNLEVSNKKKAMQIEKMGSSQSIQEIQHWFKQEKKLSLDIKNEEEKSTILIDDFENKKIQKKNINKKLSEAMKALEKTKILKELFNE